MEDVHSTGGLVVSVASEVSPTEMVRAMIHAMRLNRGQMQINYCTMYCTQLEATVYLILVRTDLPMGWHIGIMIKSYTDYCTLPRLTLNPARPWHMW